MMICRRQRRKDRAMLDARFSHLYFLPKLTQAAFRFVRDSSPTCAVLYLVEFKRRRVSLLSHFATP